MSDYHIYECDECGRQQTRFCDGRNPAAMPHGWTRADIKDLCADCTEERQNRSQRLAATRSSIAATDGEGER